MPGGGLTAFGSANFISASFAAINDTAAPSARDAARAHEEPNRAAEADDDLRDHETEADAVRELRALGRESINPVCADRQQHDCVHAIANVLLHASSAVSLAAGAMSGK